MKVLVVGGGGREHAIVKKLSESPRVTKLYAAPGNAGIAALAECLPIKATDIDGVIAASRENNIDLVFVAPDDPLALGMVDALEEAGIRAFGPHKDAAAIEGSKVFSKNLMKKYGIPTADFEIFESPSDAVSYIESRNKFPVVIKADGLALGKGAIIAHNMNEAKDAVRTIMEDKIFGTAGNRLVVEEFMTGREATVLAFTDGTTISTMVSSQDHKQVFDGNKGPNTGGMGAFAPSPFYTEDVEKRAVSEIFIPTIRAMEAENRKFKGVIYFQLMMTAEGPKVVEYNARFGDPETQAVLPLLKTDLMDIIDAVIDEKLADINIEWLDAAAVCLVLASGGYPGSYEKGYEITGLNSFDGRNDIYIYHAGTAKKDGKTVTAGGRVLGITSIAENISAAAAKSYDAVNYIKFDKMHYRKDIGTF